MTYFLGLDVSTTGSKALLIDQKGEVIGTASSAHMLSSPKPLWSEQDPGEWWQAVIKSVQTVIAQTQINSAEIEAVGLTGQMHGLVLLDEDGQVLRPAILWNDQRCQAQCDEIHSRIGKERFIQISGNVALTGFTAPKILWVAENEPEVYARARHVLLPKDYIRYKLTGEFAMDKADGSGTVLFDIKTRDWSDEILASLDIPREWMPPTFEGPEITGLVSAEAAALTGLAQATPVMAGGGDQAAGAVGVGAVEPGIIGLTVGTSGVIFATTPSALVEPQGRLHAFCHAVPGLWHFMGVMLSAAGSLQWYRDSLAPEASFDQLLQEAEAVPAGSEGLLFLPYLSGERTPYPDPFARGAFIGLTLRHTRAHMTRAILEGVAFGLKDSFTLIRNAGLEQINQVRASGGGTKGALWCQILADVLESELVSVNTTEGAAFGAALLAGVGKGAWPDVVTACHENIHITGKTTPNPENFEVYQQAYQVYRELYPLLKNTFTKLDY
ncbi:MAG TPA: xylulokinase [Chloroflexi bacterium]|nr:xylulokinase [Chloroflexota bacterium]